MNQSRFLKWAHTSVNSWAMLSLASIVLSVFIAAPSLAQSKNGYSLKDFPKPVENFETHRAQVREYLLATLNLICHLKLTQKKAFHTEVSFYSFTD